MSKATKHYALFAVMVTLLVIFIQAGRYTLLAERVISKNDENRYGAPSEVKPIEITTADSGEKMARKRIVARGFIDNPNLLTQIDVNRLKELSITDRKRILGFYRVFLHPETPDKKALIIELETTLLTLETEKDFDNWVLTTFP